MSDIPKAYEAKNYEDDIYARWERSGFFTPENLPNYAERPPYTIVLPPPNATGKLHAGHTMMLAIEDLLIRYHRMKGDRTLWVPGTDHAAIATNAMVAKELADEGNTRHDLGREDFVERVKTFIANSQDNMRRQIRKMGSSLDWTREAYTWDESRNFAVRTMFKKMYDDGLIYRGFRLVNWCPNCHSTLSDDEVEYREERGKLYWIKYGPFILATSRPETKLGDTAVAVHPRDARYKKMMGHKYFIPGVLGEFEVVVVADETVDPEFGSGAVKVTPAHSFTDYEIAERHGVKMKQIIDEDGRMMANCGKYAGMTTAAARVAIVADMQKMGLIDHIEENYVHNLAVCCRCKTVLEPLPSKQWFVNVSKEFAFQQSAEHPIAGLKNGEKVSLKKLMHHVVASGQIKIIPERFAKIYFHWIDILHDWCISRQIWVGHQIPVWYKNGSEEIYVDVVSPPDAANWTQDADTLDTWFSSGMWTFSTLGWPNLESPDLKIYHPTAVLETMFDILFTWVARMIMMTTYALGEVPFAHVYLHAKVLDRDGEKMSKSKPETMIEPLEVCEKYGTDALRLSLLVGVAPGADLRLSDEKIAGFRNFTNKLWNIARFVGRQGEYAGERVDEADLTTLDKWILTRLAETIAATTEAIEKFDFARAADLLRDFTWDDFADWYLEGAKVEGSKVGVANFVLQNLLKLWHPFMPFVTEVLWQEMYAAGEEDLLLVAAWPNETEIVLYPEAVVEFARTQKVIKALRWLRAEHGCVPKDAVAAVVISKFARELAVNQMLVNRLSRCEVKFKESGEPELGTVVSVIDEAVVAITPPQTVVEDVGRVQTELDEVAAYAERLRVKLGDAEFLGKAPAAVIQNEQKKLADAEEKIIALKKRL